MHSLAPPPLAWRQNCRGASPRSYFTRFFLRYAIPARSAFSPIQLPASSRAPLKQHTEVRVRAELLEKYVGRYGEPPNLILVVRREGDRLSIQENDEPTQDLFAESERDFFSKVADDALTFETDSQGRVTRMVLHTGGRDIPINRID